MITWKHMQGATEYSGMEGSFHIYKETSGEINRWDNLDVLWLRYLIKSDNKYNTMCVIC